MFLNIGQFNKLMFLFVPHYLQVAASGKKKKKLEFLFPA